MSRKFFYIVFMILAALTTAFAAPAEVWKTGQTASYNSGDDGAIQAGVSWPSPRFADNGDETVSDILTGLEWAKGTSASGPPVCTPGGYKTWQGALDYVVCLNTNNYLGHNDWRLPNVNELYSLIDRSNFKPALPVGISFKNVINTQQKNTESSPYWSSTSHSLYTDTSWIIDMFDGAVIYAIDSAYSYAWPVRLGQCGSAGNSVVCLSKTGQTASYSPGDDGAIQAGVSWPSPRFADNGDETVTDNLTGLEWTKDADAPGADACNTGISKTWQGALDHVVCLNTNNYLGHNDWRLPNINELYSLIDRSEYGPALPDAHPFINAQSDWYWSGSSSADDTNSAWGVHMSDGIVDYGLKGTHLYVWPVRLGLFAALAISKSGTGSGTVTADPGTIVWNGYAGTANYVPGTVLTLTASENAGSIFSGWSGGCTGTGTCNVTMNGDTNITATFSSTSTGTPKISINPMSVNCGNIKVGSTSSKSVKVKNTGKGLLIISSVTIAGADASEFNQTNNCTAIPAGGSCSFTVAFEPAATPFGNKNATMSIFSNDPKKQPSVNVKLSGQASPPKISVVPSSINFGKVAVGSISKKKTVTIKNTGISDLTINSITLIGANAEEFSETNNCSAIAKGSSCVINVAFSPAIAGAKSTSLSISSNDPNPKKQTLSVTVRGSGS
jgi:hypothetical protein